MYQLTNSFTGNIEGCYPIHPLLCFSTAIPRYQFLLGRRIYNFSFGKTFFGKMHTECIFVIFGNWKVTYLVMKFYIFN
ncbi:hypothetical protein VNO80_19030 [Phaseolus coccineus]|uniref:Uncharacterized protein n=1 Tax=Phaseolus coccineus TaxID=3886 RepID=A0AAN9MEV0_PHACN